MLGAPSVLCSVGVSKTTWPEAASRPMALRFFQNQASLCKIFREIGLAYVDQRPNHSAPHPGRADRLKSLPVSLAGVNVGVGVPGEQSTVLKMAGAIFTQSIFSRRAQHSASSKYDIGRNAPSRDKWRHCNLMVTDLLCLAIGRGVRYRWYLFSNRVKRGVSHCR